MKLIEFCIYMYIFLKPFYISKSGTVQISDLFLLFAFTLMIFLKYNKKNNDGVSRKIKPLLIFVFMVLIINFVYFVIYETKDFLMSSIQYIFIIIGIYVFYNLINNKKIIYNIKRILSFNILLQLVIFLIGAGRYFGNVRYMGTFNDPNQFAFFIFLALMIIKTSDEILNNNSNKTIWILYFVGLFLIIQSASTGMLLGMTIFTLLTVGVNIKQYLIKFKKYIVKIVCMLFLILSISSGCIILYYGDLEFRDKVQKKMTDISTSQFMDRLTQKISVINEENKNNSFIEDRCIDKIILYPHFLIFGAGQGNYNRYDLASSYNEIHSTLPSILFYYGIIPFIILIYWIYINIKGLKFKQYIPYIAILIESFTLLNQRQLLLWYLIILANCLKGEDLNKDEENINYNGNIQL